MREMIKPKDHECPTILAVAASTGEKYIFDTVLAAVVDELDPAEVSHLLDQSRCRL